MNETTQKGSGDGFSDWAVIILAGLMFFKTSDLLSYFSPAILSEIIGMDVSVIFGMMMGLFVEGVSVAYHFNKRARNYLPAQFSKWLLLGISAVCQVLDAKMVSGTIEQMSETQKVIFSVGIPLLPMIVMVLLFFVGTLPEEGAVVEKKPFKGIMNMLPSWKRILYGDQGVVAPSFIHATTIQEPPVPEIKPVLDEGKQPENFPAEGMRTS